jgi:hypothetical protein
MQPITHVLKLVRAKYPNRSISVRAEQWHHGNESRSPPEFHVSILPGRNLIFCEQIRFNTLTEMTAWAESLATEGE